MDKILLDGFTCDGSAAFIVRHPTGVVYDIQHGGMSCNHTQVEGFIFDTDWKLAEQLEMNSRGELSELENLQISKALPSRWKHDEPKLLSYGHGKMEEALVECIVEFNGKVYDVVLTWGNCD